MKVCTMGASPTKQKCIVCVPDRISTESPVETEDSSSSDSETTLVELECEDEWPSYKNTFDSATQTTNEAGDVSASSSGNSLYTCTSNVRNFNSTFAHRQTRRKPILNQRETNFVQTSEFPFTRAKLVHPQDRLIALERKNGPETETTRHNTNSHTRKNDQKKYCHCRSCDLPDSGQTSRHLYYYPYYTNNTRRIPSDITGEPISGFQPFQRKRPDTPFCEPLTKMYEYRQRNYGYETRTPTKQSCDNCFSNSRSTQQHQNLSRNMHQSFPVCNLNGVLAFPNAQPTGNLSRQLSHRETTQRSSLVAPRRCETRGKFDVVCEEHPATKEERIALYQEELSKIRLARYNHD